MQGVMKIVLVIAMGYGIFLNIDKDFLLEYIVEVCVLGVGLVLWIWFKIYKSMQIKEPTIKIQFLED